MNAIVFVLLGVFLSHATLGGAVTLHETHFNHHRLDEHLGHPTNPSLVHLVHDHQAKPSGLCGVEDECYYMLHLGTTSPSRPHATIGAMLKSEDVHRATTAGHTIVFSSVAKLRAVLPKADVVDLWLLPPSMKLDRELRNIVEKGDSACASEARDQRRHVITVKHAAGSAGGQELETAIAAVFATRVSQSCILKRSSTNSVKGTSHLYLANACHCGQQLAQLAELHYVRWMELSQRFVSLNNIATVTMQDPVHAQHHTLWEHGITGTTQVIAVGDTGLDYDSCFFRDIHEAVAFFPETNPKHRKVLSYKECIDENGNKEHMDKANAHGTHVAGSAAGNSLGANSEYNGMAKGSKIFFHDLTCGSDESGLYLPGDLYDFFVPQYEIGARVGSNSWGSNTPKTYTAVDRETDRFSYMHSDYLAVFAAGNNAYNGILSPSASKNVLTVGAHENSLQSMKRGHIASFSAHGPTYDGRVKPEVTAPGSPVYSAKSDGVLNSNQCSITEKSGTSMATPFVGGSATLLREYLQLGYHPSGTKNATAAITPTGALLKALLIHSTVPMEFTDLKETPNKIEGFGRLELNRLFAFSDVEDTTQHTMRFFQNVSLGNDETFTKCFSYLGNSIDIVATLVWMDPPNVAEGAHMSISNDLDVTIADSTGTLHYANGEKTYTRGQNVERVTISAASVPTELHHFTVHVHGAHVDSTSDGNGQPFALVLSGQGLVVNDISKCSNNKCPNDCSNHGECVNGQCQCAAGYHLVDCSECDAATVCHGNGQCDAATKKCTCNAQVAPNSEHCSTCATGYFGPHCQGTCSCGAHGACDFDSGICQCHNTDTKGHWHGPHCSLCAPDFMDVESGCKKAAYWCENKKVRHITAEMEGTIMINDWGSYANSQQCAWLIEAGHPSWRVKLVITKMEIEETFDTVSVYNGDSDAAPRLQRVTGTTTTTTSSTGPAMFIKFDADYMGPSKGFTAKFSIIRSCSDHMCHGHGKCNERSTCTCDDHFNASTFCSSCDEGWSGSSCSDGGATNGSNSTSPAPVPTGAPTGTQPQTTSAPTSPCVAPNGKMCNGHGECNADQTMCNCAEEFVGPSCQAACPVVPIGSNSKPCSGRGECTFDGCVCEAPTRNTGGACQVVTGMLVKLNGNAPMERISTTKENRWAFGTFAASPLPADSSMQPVIRMVVKNLKPVTTKFPFRLMIWDGVTNVGDMRKAHVSTVEVANGALCVEMVGWRDDSYFGVFDGSTNQSISNDAMITVEELNPIVVPGCRGQLCEAKRCMKSGPSVNVGRPTVNNKGSTNTNHKTPSFRIEPKAAAVGGSVGAIVGIIIFIAVKKSLWATSGEKRASRYAVADVDESGESMDDDLEFANSAHPAAAHDTSNALQSPGAHAEAAGDDKFDIDEHEL